MAKRHRVKDVFKLRGRSFLDPRDRQLEKLTALGDPLVRLNNEIDWEIFRPELDLVYDKERKSAAGRKAGVAALVRHGVSGIHQSARLLGSVTRNSFLLCRS